MIKRESELREPLRQRGRMPQKRLAAIEAIRQAIADEKYTVEQLRGRTVSLDALATEFGFERKTFTDALKLVLSASVEDNKSKLEQIGNGKTVFPE